MREYSSGRLEGGVGWKFTFSGVHILRAFLYTVDFLLTDTVATSTQCPSQEDVCLKESQLKRSKERQGPTLGKTCLRRVHLIKVSEKRVDFTTFLLK